MFKWEIYIITNRKERQKMNEYLKVTIIDEYGEEEIYNRVDSLDFFKNYADYNLLFKIEKLSDEEFKETE